jgi:quinol-cytochrome oxidoreductase complex cytochrome b subunit
MSENVKEKEIVFFPNFLFRETIAALIIVAAIVIISLMHPMKVGDPADPSDSSFKPRPEWYFMAPFYLLKIFPSSLEIVPTVIGPALLFLGLLVFPFFDKDPERSPLKRPVAMMIMVVGVIATVAFTILGILA